MVIIEEQLWMLLVSITIGANCNAFDCVSFHNRWTVSGENGFWGSQTMSRTVVDSSYVIIVNCSYEPIDESVVRCLSNPNDNIIILKLIRCSLNDFDIGDFLYGVFVFLLQIENDGHGVTNTSVILHDMANVTKINFFNLTTNGVFVLKLKNKTIGLCEVNIDGHDLSSIEDKTDWTLLSSVKNFFFKNGKLVTFSALLPKDLEILDLSNNLLKNLSPSTFSNMNKLESLFLSNNRLTSFDGTIFKSLRRLEVLDLSKNRLRTLNRLNLNRLIRLNVSHNQLTVAYGESLDMGNLLDLDISNNQVNSISGTFASKSLVNLDVSGNKLTKVELSGLTNLNKLVLSNNPHLVLSKTNPFGTSSKLIRVEAVNCHLRRLPNIHGRRDKKLTMDLSNNQMKNITLPLYSDSEKVIIIRNSNIDLIRVEKNFEANVYTVPVSYSLLDNRPACNCTLWNFLEFLQQPEASDFFTDFSKLKCNSGHTLNDTFSSLFCPGRSCPKQCHCGAVVNCSSFNLDSAPSSIPFSLTKVYLEFNSIRNLSNMDPHYWNHVTHLYLGHNDLSSTENWAIPTSLVFLSLSNNLLKGLSSELMEKVAGIPEFRIFLAYNNWECNCSLMTFMKSSAEKIKDSSDTVCKVYFPANRSYVEFPIENLPIHSLCSSNSTAVATVITVVMLFLLGVVGLAYYARGSITDYLRNQNLVSGIFVKPMETDKEYDALVLYHEANVEMVEEVINHLEPRSRLLIPGRDSDEEPGNAARNCEQWIQRSRAVILLMTKESLEAQDFRQQCLATYKHKCKDKNFTMIPIICGDLMKFLGALADDRIRQIVVTQKYMFWDDKWFWQKLRLAVRGEQGANDKWGRLRTAWKRTADNKEKD